MQPQPEHDRRRSLFGFDPEFLARHDEPVLDPELPIVDRRHHLWDHGYRYLFDEFLEDISSPTKNR